MKKLISLASLFLATLAVAQKESRPTVLLTGYWPPTNEMVREFSQDSLKNPGGWKGENFLKSGFNVVSYFPEFKKPNDSVGEGDFKVSFSDTEASFNTIVPQVNPIAIISFGRGSGPWEVEKNATDYWHNQPTLQASLPVAEIVSAVNKTGAMKAWIDTQDDAGDYLCGFLFRLGAEYKYKHPSVKAQGFIHVGDGYTSEQYRTALIATLKATFKSLKK